MSVRFDHLAIGAATLAQGVAWARERLGVEPPPGGAHAVFATHNHLTATGPDTFLEIIAPDPAARPERPRWFGLDDPAVAARLAAGPRPHAVVLATDDLDAALTAAREAGVDLGAPVAVTRGDLRWRFAVRADGAIPLDGVCPLIMEWPPGFHPAGGMRDLDVRYRSIVLETPDPGPLSALLDAWGGAPAPLSVARVPAPRLRCSVTVGDRAVALQGPDDEP